MADQAIKLTKDSDVLSFYPVGSIYLSVNSTNPGTLFGGTWQQLKDRFLLGAGDTYSNESTGGAATVTLTAAQSGCYNHTHTYSDSTVNSTTSAAGTHQHTIDLGWDPNNLYLRQAGSPPDSATGWYVDANQYSHRISLDAKWSTSNSRYGTPTSTVGNHSHTLTTSSSSKTTGARQADASTAHNNMPPYLVVYMWKRTA